MVKVGQRKFLKNRGYTDEELDKMSTSSARNIIAYYEKKAQEKRISEDREIRKQFEDEIVELKELIRALKSSHYLSHQAYLFAKNEGLDLQKQERQKVIEELEEWIVSNYSWGTLAMEPLEVIDFQELYRKLNEMKGETE